MILEASDRVLQKVRSHDFYDMNLGHSVTKLVLRSQLGDLRFEEYFKDPLQNHTVLSINTCLYITTFHNF